MRCEDVARMLPETVEGTPVDLAMQTHIESCLRCQAELARYRRMLRALQQLRTRFLEPSPSLLAQTLAALEEAGERHAVRSLLSGRRLAYAGAIGGAALATAGTAAALILARSRRRTAVAWQDPADGLRRAAATLHVRAPARPEGSSSIWQSTGLQNRRLGVRVPPALLPRRINTEPTTSNREIARYRGGDVNRQTKRLMQRQQADRPRAPERKARPQAAPQRERTGPRQYLGEVRGELKKVAWPSRHEVVNSTIIVLIAVVFMTSLIFGYDYLSAKLVLFLFD